MPVIFFFEFLAFLKIIKQKGVNPWKLLFSAYIFTYFQQPALVFETCTEGTKIFYSQ